MRRAGLVSGKMRLTALALLLLVAAVAPSACGGGGPDVEAQYSELLCDLTASFVDFTSYDLKCSVQDEEPSVQDLASKRDRFRTVLLELEEMTPAPDFVGLHNVCVPLFGQVLDGMDMMVEAAESNDVVQELTGRILLTEAAGEIVAAVGAD
jgi:hypothetical protein